MHLEDKIVVVTGGASGIGRALALRFATERPRAVVVIDRDAESARSVAASAGGIAIDADVACEAEVSHAISEVVRRYGRVDLYCSNAGILRQDPEGAASATNETWQSCWEVNVMAHVYAVRALLPIMRTQGGGTLLFTVSAAGLLAQIGSATYTVTKHAALAFAEYVAIEHGDEGIRVFALCPQAVDTPMLHGAQTAGAEAVDGTLTPEAVAECAIRGLADGNFLILPHPSVSKYALTRAQVPDRWLGGMRKLRRSLKATPGAG